MLTTREYKVASLRLFYDMTTMDGYVHSQELMLMESIKSADCGLDITPDMVRDAHLITTADALNTLREWKNQEEEKEVPGKKCSISQFYTYLHALANSDGPFSLKESRLAAAAYWAIDQEAYCISIPESKLKMSKHELLYIDGEDGSVYDEEIVRNTSVRLKSDELFVSY